MFQNFKSLKREGQRFIVSVPEENTEEWYTVAYTFVKELLIGVANQSQPFLSNPYQICDYPFTYKERQMESLVVPVLAKLCDGIVYTEYPVERKLSDGQISSGHYDFFCIYNNYSIVIEMKHDHDCANTDLTRKKLRQHWQTMCKQLRNIRNSVVKNEEATNGVIRLGLHFVVSQDNSMDVVRPIMPMDCKFVLNRISDDLSYRKPEFGGCWLLDKGKTEYDDESILGLYLFSKFYKPINHKGMAK